MPVHNADVATIFNEIADLLELEEANPFRVRAYRNAARVVGDLSRDLVLMVDEEEDLTERLGVGADLSGKFREIVITRPDLDGSLAQDRACIDARADRPAFVTR
jgi:DNA polymerase (family 10)